MKSTYLLRLFEFGCVESTRKVETGINFFKGITASQTPRSASVHGRPRGRERLFFVQFGVRERVHNHHPLASG